MECYKTLGRWRIGFALVLFLLTSPSRAGHVTLQWDRNTESDVAGYKLYYVMISTSATNVVDVGETNAVCLTALDAGNYQFFVTAYSRDGIESDPSNEVIYSVKEPTPPTVTVNSGRVCLGEAIELTAVSPAAVAFRWSSGATNASIVVSPESSQAYSVTVTSQDGLQATAEAIVTVDLPPIVTVKSGSIRRGESIVLTAESSDAVSYLWSNGATTRSISVSPETTQPFSVSVRGAGDCAASASAVVTVNVESDLPKAPAPALLGVGVSNGVLTVSVAGQEGDWVLEESSDLVLWTSISTGAGTQLVNVPTTSKQGFFRVRSIPTP